VNAIILFAHLVQIVLKSQHGFQVNRCFTNVFRPPKLCWHSFFRPKVQRTEWVLSCILFHGQLSVLVTCQYLSGFVLLNSAAIASMLSTTLSDSETNQQTS